MKKISVLIVEDSAVVQQLLQHIIGSDPRLETLATASSAEEALDMMQRITPDVISLDIRLPAMNGFEATRRIMRDKPTPIVVCSASVESDDLKIAMTALRAGALAVVEKPVGTTRENYERLAGTLCTQLAIMSEVKVVRQRGFLDGSPARSNVSSPHGTRAGSGVRAASAGPLRIVGIGASTGGPNAVVQVLNDLGGDFPLPVLLVQHMMPSFLPGFAAWLESVTPFRAVIARNGDVVKPGTVYVAPADYHLHLETDRVGLTQDPPASLQRPSATMLFRSMARSAGDAGLGILLTGMGDDGADGLLELRRAGGHTMAESESTAVVYGMPKAAVDRGAACECLPLPDIGLRTRALIGAARKA
jgi:two-component system chemotaxis response regulator CheB